MIIMRCVARLLMIMVSLEVSGRVRKALSLPRFFAPPQDFQREERKNRRMKQKKLSHIYVVFVIQNLKFGTLPWHPVILVKKGCLARLLMVMVSLEVTGKVFDDHDEMSGKIVEC